VKPVTRNCDFEYLLRLSEVNIVNQEGSFVFVSTHRQMYSITVVRTWTI